MLTGFWHGASWNFLLWGLYFGIILILEKLFLLKILDKLPKFISHIYALVLIIFGWALFYYSDDVGGFKALAEFIPSLFTGGFISDDALHISVSYLPMLAAGLIASTPVIRKIYDKLKCKINHFEILEAAAIIILLIICTASLVNNAYNPFIYFKF